MTTLIATSVVRGSQQGDSHGGVFLLDLGEASFRQVLDWNTIDIDWQGRGWDRGLRGITFANEQVYIAASDELFAFTPEFELIGSWRNPYLRHCHEITLHQGNIFLSSTGFDSVLAFDIERKEFHWGLHLQKVGGGVSCTPFKPGSRRGPGMRNSIHINNIVTTSSGMYVSGLHSGALLHFDGRQMNTVVSLPEGTHNACLHGEGVLFNDSRANCVRYVSRSGNEDRSFPVPDYHPDELTHTEYDESGIARARFGRGLAVLSDNLIAAGSSPSTVAVHDLSTGSTTAVHTLSFDIRNAIHGLEIWPF